MIIGEDSYTWNPNFLMYEDPETARYKGNVVGNTPLELQIAKVNAAGQEQIQAITETGQAQISDVKVYANRYTIMWNLIASVTNDILGEFGGGFIIGSSALDSGVLY